MSEALCSPDEFLFQAESAAYTASRDWVPSDQMQSSLSQLHLCSLWCCCSHWESLSNQYHWASTPLRILYLHSWTFQEPLFGYFDMTTVGVFHSFFNACGPLTRDQEREGYLPPSILLGSNLLQFNCTMFCRGKGVLTRTFLAISEGFCPPSDNISQTAGITRQLLSIYCLQQDKKNVATVSQM